MLMPGCSTRQGDLSNQTVENFTRDATWDVLDMRIQYLLYLPPAYDDPTQRDRRWPLIVYMHGIGENGGDPARIATVPGLPQALEQGLELPAIVVSPHNTGQFNSLWHTDAMLALIEELQQQYRIDPQRISLTGVSLGGYTAWSMACVNPDRYAAIVPVSAWGYPAEIAHMSQVPVWAFHGQTDLIVPASRHQALISAHRQAGGQAMWTLIPAAGHNAAKDVYHRSDLYDWLLKQRSK